MVMQLYFIFCGKGKYFQFGAIYLRENVFIIPERAFWGEKCEEKYIYFPFILLFLDVLMDDVCMHRHAPVHLLLP